MERLSWKREPRETGLRAVTQGERGYDLRYGGIEVARVRPLKRNGGGYYWYARADELGVGFKNTAYEPVATVEEAKAQAFDYVKGCLSL